MKCTVASLVPWPLTFNKPGLAHDEYKIDAAKGDGGIAILHVDNTKTPFLIPGHERMKTIGMPVVSEEISRSIVEDFFHSQVAVGEDAAPGLFWVPGQFTVTELKAKYAIEINHHRERQNRWFANLVRDADAVWMQTRQVKMITDLQKRAARALKLTRDWLVEIDINAVGAVVCPACRNPVPAEAIVCGNCKCILDAKKAEALAFMK